MKKLMFTVLILLSVLVLAGCQQQAQQPLVSDVIEERQGQQSPLDTPTDAPTSAVEGLPPGYNPSLEEDPNLPITEGDFDASGVALHAGATPIPLDPVDMPSPTPRPALTFTFATYTASNLGLTFESVAGYTVDDSQPDVYVLTEPIEQQKDNYSVVFTFSRSSVGNNYTIDTLRNDLRTFAADLGKVNYKEWRVSDTADRTLLGKPGRYVTYRGVMHDDTIVRGRIHMALLDNNRVLTIHYTGPGEYNTDYSNTVFTRIRSTLKAI
ncbi:MAG: hypothetical protein GX171_06590 [Clostridiales bacterium]|jgi:hypothetical protein|nr:hypothetical protein [Clostridiales bacterium]